MFYVGQKVVCVDDSDTTAVRAGQIYEVEDVLREYLVVSGVRQPGGTKHGMFKTRFRPVVERKTSIEIFQRMLTPTSRETERVS